MSKKKKVNKKIAIKKVSKRKSRIHIYVHEDVIVSVDEKAEQLGLDRSPFIQHLIKIGLNNVRGINNSDDLFLLANNVKFRKKK